MSSTPKINKIEINNAYNIKDNNRIKHTQYSYEKVDNGTIENSETFFPYNSFNYNHLFVSSNYFLDANFDKSYLAECHAELCPPSITFLGAGGDAAGRGQIMSVIGNEMIYGIYYTTCTYSHGTISKRKYAVLIHTMQGLNPYFYNIDSSIGFQWNYSNDSSLPIMYDNISNIQDLPTKSMHFATRYVGSNSEYYFICQPFAGYNNFQERPSNYWNEHSNKFYFPYDSNEASPSTPPSINYTNYLPDYNVVTPENLNLGSDFPFYITHYRLPSNRYGIYANNHLIHNVKKKQLSNISYLCSDLPSYIPYYRDSGGDYYSLKFDARLLPTKAYNYYGNGLPMSLCSGTGATGGYDVCRFLHSYSQFKYSGLTIRPAKLDHDNYTTSGQCCLPTIDVNDKSELVPYQDNTSDLYAPIDVDKCEEIIQIIKNIVSTSINEVFITTYDVAYENGGVGHNPEATAHPEFTTKKDLSTFRNETEGNLQRYI